MALRAKKNMTDRLSALSEAAEMSTDILDPSQTAALRQVADAASQRRALSGSHTVVGFFGATGSGKTSLFNAVVGEDLGVAAARRPTTSSPLAAIWGAEGAEELLDWLEVEDRRVRPGEFPAGKQTGPLILLDLPDFDSVEVTNRATAARLAEQVDVLVWVSDPQKYADSVMHREFIRPHASHASVTLAVLNKADTLTAQEATEVTASFKQLLVEDGLSTISVIATSATTGSGIDEVRAAIARVASSHQAAEQRISSDIEAVTAPWAGLKAPGTEAKEIKRARRDLDTALTRAANADYLANVTAKAYRKRLGQRTGWLLTSWLLRFRPDPLKRLGLTEAADDTGVHHSSLPALDAAHKAMANTGVRAYASALSEGMPVEWANEIADTTETVAANVPEALDRAIQKTELPAQPSGGWFIFSFLQWVALLMALVGVLWYLAVAFLPGIVVQFWTKGYPEVEGWPVPTLLIAGGILLGILLGLFTSAFGGIIGASVRRRTTKALTREVSAMAETTVVAPLHAVRERYARFLELIAAARA
ncbi:MAG: GTPase [Corynebacterium sp.]|nr:GTPase [Corynebacterium sp.]